MPKPTRHRMQAHACLCLLLLTRDAAGGRRLDCGPGVVFRGHITLEEVLSTYGITVYAIIRC